MTDRITRDEEGLLIAEAVKARADSTRRQVGAVIMATDGSIVSTGRNGLAAGRPGCLTEGACPRGRLTYPEPPCAVGDQISDQAALGESECQAESPDAHGWLCTRATGHGEWHIAGDGSTVLAVWPVVGTQAADIGYEETGCRAIHAEVNAIIRAGRAACVGATMYITEAPCFHCSVVIEGAGITRVVTPQKENKS